MAKRGKENDGDGTGMGSWDGDNSEADMAVHDLLAAEDEPLDLCTRPHILIDTGRENVEEVIERYALALGPTQGSPGGDGK
ncbi:MAG: hypothetical protein J7L61_01870, partial [Thermoplasmata archaeon]|nr:hypothetical protein [Thermoplasmata archaeon]